MMERTPLVNNERGSSSGESSANYSERSSNSLSEITGSIPEEPENLSNAETAFNICCGITGTGLLAMAFVFRCSGIWALFIIPVVAIAGNYTGQILIELLYDLDANGVRYRAREGYLDIGEKFLPNFGKVFVNAVNLIENFAHCVLILLLTGGIMNELIPVIDDDIWTVLCTLPLFAVIFLERIRSLAKIGLATITAGLILVAFTTGYSLRFTGHWERSFETAKIFELNRLSLGIGITVVSYACQPYLPFIEKDMKDRDSFGKVMNISYAVVTVIKVVSGLFIYLAYENNTHTIMTLDLPHGPLRTICSLMLFVVALTFFIFPMFTVFNIIDQNWPKRFKNTTRANLIRHFVRLILLCLATITAVFTPHFGLGVALVGNFTANILIFILPCACHIKFNYPNLKLKYLIVDVLILVICTILGVIGIVASLSELAISFNEEDLNPTEPLHNLR